MSLTPYKPGVLVLEQTPLFPAREFEGFLLGGPTSAKIIRSKANRQDQGYGEIVFNTSMTGYQEILTDPSYYGEIVCMTVPHIGNTGVNLEDIESKRVWCAGFVLNEYTPTPSNWRAKDTLDQYLKTYDIPAIFGIDTRALTRHLRQQGAVRGVILPLEEREIAQKLLKELPAFEGRDLIREVTTATPYDWPSKINPKAKFKVVALDFGIKTNLLRKLEEIGCQITVMPAETRAESILAQNPNGVFLSNGPGDPAAATYAIETVQKLLGKVPLFGVCMGHQILGLALGAKTYKLKFGHRGGNQPVLDHETHKVEISSHNHGYAVDAATLPASARVSHINLNDQCVEGLAADRLKAFSVQYHPEACPGPQDSEYLF